MGPQIRAAIDLHPQTSCCCSCLTVLVERLLVLISPTESHLWKVSRESGCGGHKGTQRCPRERMGSKGTYGTKMPAAPCDQLAIFSVLNSKDLPSLYQLSKRPGHLSLVRLVWSFSAVSQHCFFSKNYGNWCWLFDFECKEFNHTAC